MKITVEWLAEFVAWNFQWDYPTLRAQPSWLVWGLYRTHETRIAEAEKASR